MANASHQVNMGAVQLSRLADELQRLIGGFKVDDKPAYKGSFYGEKSKDLQNLPSDKIWLGEAAY